MPDSIIADLTALVGADIVVTPDSSNLMRYTRDYAVEGSVEIGVLAIVLPRNVEQVSKTLKYCNEKHVAVQPQGGLTGLAGGAVPTGPCVVLNLERMRAIRELDDVAGTITVEAGVVMEAVQKAADAADLLYPLDLGGRGSCQTGGNLSTNAGGNRVLRYGMARELVLGLEVVLADGTIIHGLRKMIKNNAGYDLRQLFIGSEGTLGIITAAVLRLFPKPRSQCTALCAVADYSSVIALLTRVRSGFASQLSAFEVMWPDFYALSTRGLGRNPPLGEEHGLYVLIETLGPDPQSDQKRFEIVITEALESSVINDAVVAQSQREASDLWSIRDSPAEWKRAGHWPHVSFDVSTSTGQIGELVERIRGALSAKWPQIFTMYFGHVADGNLHLSVRLNEDHDLAHAIEVAVYDVVAEFGGSISAEHGIGTLKREFLHLSRTPDEIALMHTLKRAMDPNGILNPGKVL